MALYDETNGLNVFGFSIKRKQDTSSEKLKSFVPETPDDGSIVSSGAAYNSFYLDIDPSAIKNGSELVRKYREISLTPELDAAISEIVDEAIIPNEGEKPISIDFFEDDSKKLTESTKKQITSEFDEIIRLLNFNFNGQDIFREWYIDGGRAYHIIVDQNSPKTGIKQLRSIDMAKLKKVTQIKKDKDTKTGATIVTGQEEFFVYHESTDQNNATGLKITTDAIAYASSGLIDRNSNLQISYLHKAIRPLNQLRMMEDSDVIYRMTRAPERRVFYIDTSGMQRAKAEQHLKDVMARYKNKEVYDITTGTVKNDKKHLSMLEDFWLPRTTGGKGTEITTLPAGAGLGSIENIEYFQQGLYRSLNIPLSRLQQGQGTFNLGRGNEISRDEIKFAKFIAKLRLKFSYLFYDLLKKQLLLKGITTEEDWSYLKNTINIKFSKDNFWSEIKEAEMLRDRLQTVAMAEQYSGKYFSQRYISRTILKMSEEELEKMQKEIDEEVKLNPPEEAPTQQ
jgi:Bacteriophage T4-like portal protein (Gp20)